MTFEEKLDELHALEYAFGQTPAYKPYQAPGNLCYLITYDIYTDPKYHEPDVRRWGIYYGKMRPGTDVLRLQHGKGMLAKYFDTPEEAQAALDRHADLKGWTVISKAEKETT